MSTRHRRPTTSTSPVGNERLTVSADGKIYLQSEQGDGIVLQPGAKYMELAKNPLEPRTFASYAVADGALFIRTEKQLYRIQQQ